jgi:catechol 2,3-dioxygenase
MTMTARPRLTHIGVNVFDLQKMADFYTTVFGLLVTDQGRGTSMPIDLVFLSADPGTHHQIVLATGRDVNSPTSTINQISFSLDSLDELKAMCRKVRDYGIQALRPVNHGMSWSVYFPDPEGNTVELYVDSPWYISQPHAEPFDPEESTEKLLRDMYDVCKDDPRFMPIGEFQDTVRARLAGETPTS